MKAYKNILELLELLKLKGMVKSLDEIVNEAEVQRFSYLSLLHTLLQAEITYRAERRFQRNLAAAHFPVPKSLDAFEFGRVKGITKADIAQLLDFRWLDNHENLLLFGPPGLGKTHASIALGMKAIEQGYTVCFEKIVNLIKLLKTQEIQRTAGFRINRILRSDLLIIDEIGYTPIDRKEANLFFNLVSELYEKKSIIITSNKGFESWAEMMGESNTAHCNTARWNNSSYDNRSYTSSLWEDIPGYRESYRARRNQDPDDRSTGWSASCPTTFCDESGKAA